MGRIRFSLASFAAFFSSVLHLGVSFLPGMWRQSSPSSMPWRLRWILSLFSAAAPSSSLWLRLGALRNWRRYDVTPLSCPSRRSKSVSFRLVSARRIVSVILVLLSSSGVFLRQILRALWRRSRSFFARVTLWAFNILMCFRRLCLHMIPSPFPPFPGFFDGPFGAPALRRRRVPRAPFPSPMQWLAAFRLRRRFALAIGPVLAPSIDIISDPPALCDGVDSLPRDCYRSEIGGGSALREGSAGFLFLHHRLWETFAMLISVLDHPHLYTAQDKENILW